MLLVPCVFLQLAY